MGVEDWISYFNPYGFDDEWDQRYFDAAYFHSGRQPSRIGFMHAAIIHETPKAWLVRIAEQDMWLPKSKCTLMNKEKPCSTCLGTGEVTMCTSTKRGILEDFVCEACDGVGTLKPQFTVPEWLAKRKGINNLVDYRV